MSVDSGEIEDHGIVYHYRAVVRDAKDGSWTQRVEVSLKGVGSIDGKDDTMVYRPTDPGAKYRSKPNMGVAGIIAQEIIRAYHERTGRTP